MVAPARVRPQTSDVVGTSVLGIVGLFAAVMGIRYGVTVENGQVGPGFLPLVTGSFVLLASVAELLRMFLAPPATHAGSFMQVVEEVEDEARAAVGTADAEAAELDTFGRTAKQRARAIVLIFGILLVALLLIPVIGLLLSLTLMVFTVFVAIERKPIVTSAIISAAALAIMYLIFDLGLNVPLPTGMLGLV